jgi:hypothetical protein
MKVSTNRAKVHRFSSKMFCSVVKTTAVMLCMCLFASPAFADGNGTCGTSLT